MTFGDGVPRWARRRVERHLARHGDGKVVRWMTFGAGNRRDETDGVSAEIGGNVVPFARKAPAAAPAEARSLDATGS